MAAQHEKCAFCEAKIRHTQPGDVEHFRPKAATRQSKDAPLRKPGYYWLAYEWTNLLLACAECNRRGKGNLFPLRDDARRALHHRDRIQNEEPLFVDPAAEDPSNHLGFRSWVAFPLTERGAATIEALDLNRQSLCEHREEQLKMLRVLADVRWALADDPLGQEAEELLSDRCHDDAEYAAMTRAFVGR